MSVAKKILTTPPLYDRLLGGRSRNATRPFPLQSVVGCLSRPATLVKDDVQWATSSGSSYHRIRSPTRERTFHCTVFGVASASSSRRSALRSASWGGEAGNSS